jgi:pimeloyl-ACP methyl ester carboxylesterase
MQHLLLLHGAIGAKSQFAALAEKLKGHFIIHMLDFSGHGGKPLPDTFSIKDFANNVLDYMAENNLNAVNIFGYSMGGYVALYLAKDHPGKVRKVFTLATKFDWTPEIAAREIKMLDPEKLEEKVPAFARQLEARHQPSDWKAVLRKTADMMIGLGNENPLKTEDYNHINQNVLIGIGDKDQMVTLEETIAAYRCLPQANLIVFPATQHPIEKVDVQRLSNEIITYFT